MKKIFTIFTFINLILLLNITFASEKIALNYNIIPDIPNGYVVDSNHTNQISFTLFEEEKELYCNDTILEISNNKFSICLENLSGEVNFDFKNSNGESVSYTYYVSAKDGELKNYSFNEMPNSKNKIFIKTIKDIPVIYTNKEVKAVKEIEKILLALPEQLLKNISEIKLIPASHKSKAAGITNYNKITLYKISSYSKSTIKNIVIHEIAHTWAHDLMKTKVLDYSYTDYQEAVNKDKNFPSKYAKEYVLDGNYSEDFAESISFYFINTKSFSKKFPSRTEYIKSIIEK